jgi:hypothetical protein
VSSRSGIGVAVGVGAGVEVLGAAIEPKPEHPVTNPRKIGIDNRKRSLFLTMVPDYIVASTRTGALDRIHTAQGSHLPFPQPG